jgi:hypothetical protein
MKEPFATIKTSYHGHFSRKANIEVRGGYMNSQATECTPDAPCVALTINEGGPMGSELHIYLKRRNAERLAKALLKASEVT